TDEEPSAVSPLLHRALVAFGILDQDRDIAAHHDEPARGILHHVLVPNSDSALLVGFNEGLVENLRSSADVEGAHRELGPGLADRLRRDHTDRFAEIDGRPAREGAAIALGANPKLGLAGQDRADAHFRHAPRLDLLYVGFENLLPGRNDDGASCWIPHVLRRGTTEHTLAE